MAESLQSLEESLTCSICIGVFNEPVTLPCTHSYCRECLQVFADKSSYNAGSTNKQSDNEVVISCPQCRAVTDLGMEGVAGLSVNIELAESTEALSSATRPREASPLCSLCEDNKAEALKFCPTCAYLYCDECLPVFHPNRGTMKHHVLVSMKEYRSKNTPAGGKTGSEEQTQPCYLHQQPYTIYCVTCQTVICTGCLSDHNEHTVSGIEDACEKLKAQFAKERDKCEEIRSKLNDSLAGLKDLEKHIQRHEGLQKSEILKAYNKALEALNAWKNKYLKEIENTHSDWYRRCREVLKDLEIKSEEMERIMITSRDIVSSTNVVFLQGVKQLKISIDNQLSEIRNALKPQKDVKMKLRSALELDGIVTRKLTVKETSLQRLKEPVFKFTETSHTELKISDNGFLIESDSLSDDVYYTAWTGGRLQSGHITWGLEITVPADISNYICNCTSGVVREGCNLSCNLGITSWCIGMQYDEDSVACYSPGNCRVDVARGYAQYIPHTGPNRLGFSLNCNERTLTVIDINHNQVMATVRDVDLSQPVTPAVGFFIEVYIPYGELDDCSVSVCIIP